MRGSRAGGIAERGGGVSYYVFKLLYIGLGSTSTTLDLFSLVTPRPPPARPCELANIIDATPPPK